MKKNALLLVLLLCLPASVSAQNNDDAKAQPGSVQTAEGTSQAAESAVQAQPGSVQTAEGTPQAAESAVQAQPGSVQTAEGTATNTVQPVVTPVNRTYTPRPMKKIENREFSNRDKIMLLLSAHCDFPTKEDLVSTISYDKMLEDEEEMAANASFTRRKTTNSDDTSAQSDGTESNRKTNSNDSALKADGTSQHAENLGAKSESTSPRSESPAGRKLTPEENARVEIYLQNILYTILKDDTTLLTVRRRALEALAYFSTEKNVKMLTFILTHPENIKKPLMLVQAIRSFPEVAPDKAAEILAPYLEHENDMVRFVTISTLKKTPGSEAVQVMQNRLDVETNRFFKARLEEAIQCHDQKMPTCR